MGHIINPTAMRLGWFSDWVDVWYSDRTYYVEYFCSMLKIRLFLSFYVGARRLERMGFFYSHFTIHNVSNYLKVGIYLYDGRLLG